MAFLCTKLRVCERRLTGNDKVIWFFFGLRRTLFLKRSMLAGVLILCLSASLFGQSNPSNFSTVIDVNSVVTSLGDAQTIDSDVQLNLLSGGSIGESFNAGSDDGSSTNVELNVFGGTVGPSLTANAGSTVNVFGGVLGSDNFQLNGAFFASAGSTVNVFDGRFLGEVFVENGSVVQVSGGTFEGDFTTSADIEVSGGIFEDSFFLGSQQNFSLGQVPSEVENLFGLTSITGGEFNTILLFTERSVDISGGEYRSLGTGRQGSVTISGGTLGDTHSILSELNLVGTDFFIDGEPLLIEAGESLVIDDRGVELTGQLADGSLFSLSPIEGRFGVNIAGTDSFFEDAVLRVSRVSAIPEPSPGLLLILAMVFMGHRSRVSQY